MTHPDKTDRLIILNLPHPKGLMRELANNPEQQKNSAVRPQLPAARRGQEADKPELLAFWVKEPEARKQYVEALKRSSMEGMLNYYKANYPREPYKDDREFPPVKCPVLMIHGLDDPVPAAGRAQRHLEVAGEGPDAGHRARRRATSSTATRRSS